MRVPRVEILAKLIGGRGSRDGLTHNPCARACG